MDLLDKLDKESNQEQNKSLKVEKSPILKTIIKCFESNIDELAYEFDSHKLAQRLFKKTNYTNSDIIAFCMELKNLENNYSVSWRFGDYAGRFINSLIKHLPEKEVNLVVSSLNDPLQWICSYDLKRKKINITGNLYSLGYSMRNGFVHLKGNVDSCGVGMESGKIYVDGNVDYLANCMVGGKIIVNGNVDCIEYMRGGEVEVFGDVNYLLLQNGTLRLHGDYGNATILRVHHNLNFYHKNKHLIKNGKPVKGAEIKWL